MTSVSSCYDTISSLIQHPTISPSISSPPRFLHHSLFHSLHSFIASSSSFLLIFLPHLLPPPIFPLFFSFTSSLLCSSSPSFFSFLPFLSIFLLFLPLLLFSVKWNELSKLQKSDESRWTGPFPLFSCHSDSQCVCVSAGRWVIALTQQSEYESRSWWLDCLDSIKRRMLSSAVEEMIRPLVYLRKKLLGTRI